MNFTKLGKPSLYIRMLQDRNDEAVVKLIQSFSKGIEHSPLFKTRLFEILPGNHFDTLGYMDILVKN